jgi:hypothetical protein
MEEKIGEWEISFPNRYDSLSNPQASNIPRPN